MSDKLKEKSRNKDPLVGTVKSYLPCFIKGMITAAAGIMISSFIYLKTNASEYSFYISYAALFAGALICGFSSYEKFRKRGIVTGFLSVIPLCIFILLPALLFSGETAGYYMLISGGICLAGGASGGILCVNLRH